MSTAEQTTEYMGFKVEWTEDPAQPFILHGKRGAKYGALCFLKGKEFSKDTCYLRNITRIMGHNPAVKGNRNFRFDFEAKRIITCW